MMASSPQLRAIVTGGAGFIGSHLVDRLLAEGCAALVVDDLSTGRTANIPLGAELEQLDVVDADLESRFGAWKPDVVFHLAAQASVVRSVADPLRDLEVNVIGSQRVAAAAREAGARRLVFVSSGGAIYGETTRPASERTIPAPTSYYGVHKLAAEGHVRLAGPPSMVARPSNVYGPRQAAGLEGAVVASFVEQARQGGPLTIHGDGSQTRDFVHVRDIAEALWLLGHADGPPATWNIAAGRATTVAELADTVELAHGRPLGRAWGPRRPGDITRSLVSAGPLRTLGWRPRIRLRDGISALLHGDGS